MTESNPFIAFHNSYFAYRLVAGMLVYLSFKIQIKSRVASPDQYDRMVKLDFVTQERLKTEIGLSNEKLVLLMPKFVLDRINYLEMSSRQPSRRKLRGRRRRVHLRALLRHLRLRRGHQGAAGERGGAARRRVPDFRRHLQEARRAENRGLFG